MDGLLFCRVVLGPSCSAAVEFRKLLGIWLHKGPSRIAPKLPTETLSAEFSTPVGIQYSPLLYRTLTEDGQVSDFGSYGPRKRLQFASFSSFRTKGTKRLITFQFLVEKITFLRFGLLPEFPTLSYRSVDPRSIYHLTQSERSNRQPPNLYYWFLTVHRGFPRPTEKFRFGLPPKKHVGSWENFRAFFQRK